MIRRTRTALFFICLFSLGLSGVHASTGRRGGEIPRLPRAWVLGSCHKVENAFDWRPVLKRPVDAWFWLGDAIYADGDLAKARSQFATIRSNPGYSELASRAQIEGIWDDHDFGPNNSDGTFGRKAESQKLFADFLGIPAEDERRHAEGIYYSRVWTDGVQRLLVIFLDTRYFKNLPDHGVESLLGGTQWSWLSELLERERADLTFVVSSTVVLGRKMSKEKWADFPEERTRLLEILAARPEPVILLSGDLHYSEVSEHRSPSRKRILEYTISGMTHGRWLSYWNEARILGPVKPRNFGEIRFDWQKRRLDFTVLKAGSGTPLLLHSVSW